MSNRYIWDKRDIKRNFLKFGLMLISCFFVMLGVSFALDGKVGSGAVIAICVLVGLVIVLLEMLLIHLIKKKVQKINQEKEKQELMEEVRLREEEKRKKQEEEKENNVRKKGTRKKPRNNGNSENLEEDEEIKLGENENFEFTKSKNDNVIKITKRK